MAENRINCSYCGAEFSAVLASRGPWQCPNCHTTNAVHFDPNRDCWACRQPATQWEHLPDGRYRCSHCGFVPLGTPPGDGGGGGKPPLEGTMPQLTAEQRLVAAIQDDPAIVRFIADGAHRRFENDPSPDPVVARLAALAANAPQYGEFKAAQFAELVEAARPAPVFICDSQPFPAQIVDWLRGLADLVEANR